MAYVIKRDQQVDERDRISMVTAARGDRVYFTSAAEYFAIGRLAHVLRLGGDASVSIDGQLYSADGSTVYNPGLRATVDIRVGRSGLVSSEAGAAFDLAGDRLTFTNAGEIAARTGLLSRTTSATVTNDGLIHGAYGIGWAGNYFSLTNTGAIAGDQLGVSAQPATGGEVRLLNSGTIDGGSGNGIVASNASTVDITNTGTIRGTAYGLAVVGTSDASGVRTITNDGVISGGFGSVVLSDAADRLINTGKLLGDVDLGYGNDRFDGVHGIVDGVVHGGAGNDRLSGGTGDDMLAGDAGDDILYGRGGDDWLIPGDGAGLVDGGTGVDVISFRDWTSPIDVDLNLTTIAGIQIAAIEGVEGTAGDDRLILGSFDTLAYGGDGNDYIGVSPGTVERLLVGGAGDDKYELEFMSDGSVQIVEDAGAGYDIVYSTGLGRALFDNVEELHLEGPSATNGIGNAIDNDIYGNDQANYLDGGLGADYFQGRGGADTFAVTTALSAANVDTIADFASGEDRIALSRSIFGALAAGTFTAAAFFAGAAAHDGDDRIIYNTATGALSYDPDGTGAAAQVQFAILQGHPPLAATDITIVA